MTLLQLLNMEPAIQSPSKSRSYFATTKWALVRDAGSDSEPAREQALESLLFHYRPALCEYLRRRHGYPEAVSEDLVQGFVLDKVLRKNLISKARQSRGKFRTFLATAINAYAADVYRFEQAKRRRPEGGTTPLTTELVQRLEEPQTTSDPLFDETLVRQIITEALHETRQYCTQSGIPEAWTVFNERVLNPIFEQVDPTSFENLTERCGFATIKETRNKLVSAKRVFQRQFRTKIKEFSESATEADEEIAFLSQFLDDAS